MSGKDPKQWITASKSAEENCVEMRRVEDDEPDWIKKLRELPEGESVDLGGGYRLTKSSRYSEFMASLVETEGNPEGDAGRDDDGSQEDTPGDTKDGVRHE